jgi:hypothetical protein
MGIITLLLLGAFTMIYLSNSIPKKPAFFEKAVNFLFENMKYLGVGGLIYGLVDAVITPIQVPNVDYLVVRMVSDVLIVMMALPFCFDKLAEKYQGKVNAAVIREIAGSVAWVRGKDKLVGGAGAVLCVLLFAFIFR